MYCTNRLNRPSQKVSCTIVASKKVPIKKKYKNIPECFTGVDLVIYTNFRIAFSLDLELQQIFLDDIIKLRAFIKVKLHLYRKRKDGHSVFF